MFEKQDVGLDKSLDGSAEFSRKFANLASVPKFKIFVSVFFLFLSMRERKPIVSS